MLRIHTWASARARVALRLLAVLAAAAVLAMIGNPAQSALAAGGGWADGPPMPVSRAGSINAVLTDGDLLLVGGFSMVDGAFTPLSTVMRFDVATRTWSSKAPLPHPLDGAAVVTLDNGNVLVAGGNMMAAGTDQTAAFLYDPVTDSWSPAGNLQQPRVMPLGVQLADGRVLVAGGKIGCCDSRAETDIYDPATNDWTAGPDMMVSRFDGTLDLLSNGKVLYAGGFADSYSEIYSSAELFDPTANTWSYTTPMNQPRHAQASATLQDGRLLQIGTYWGGDSSSVEAYDPASESWSSVAPMLGPRAYMEAVTLSDGGVLVSGGHAGGGWFASTERYDPVADLWTTAGDMGTPRNGHAMAALPDGSAMAAGGAIDWSNATTTSVEFYLTIDTTPPTVTWDSAVPADGASYAFGALPANTPTCSATDDGSGVSAGGCIVTGYSTLAGPHRITATATDNAGNSTSLIRDYTVLALPFGGFTQPVSSPPSMTTVQAGATVPLKFSLGGNVGLAILAPGSPASATASCTTGQATAAFEPTAAAGSSVLTYSGGYYSYIWKTSKAWSGQCRVLSMTLVDGTSHTAVFSIR